MVSNVFLDGIIEGAGHGAFVKCEGDRDDEIAILGGSIQDAFTVRELEIGF